jgi:hypothetical protein
LRGALAVRLLLLLLLRGLLRREFAFFLRNYSAATRQA